MSPGPGPSWAGWLGFCYRHGQPRLPVPLLLDRRRLQLWQLRGLCQCAHPHGYVSPRPSGRPCAGPAALSASGRGFRPPGREPPGRGWQASAGLQGFRARALLPALRPRAPASEEERTPRELGGRAASARPGRLRERGSREVLWPAGCATESRNWSHDTLTPSFLRVEKRRVKTSAALI